MPTHRDQIPGDEGASGAGQGRAGERESRLQQHLAAGAEALLAELAAGRSDHLESYLTFCSRFHRYSAANQLLIFLQCPEASQVAGFKTWQTLGYRIAKGAKAIKILAPVVPRSTSLPQTHNRAEGEIDEETMLAARAMHFLPVNVFDASQLNPADLSDHPLPAFFTPLAGNHTALAEALLRIMREDGITVIEASHRGAQGFSAGGVVGIKPGLDADSKALTLIHEYAHELLHATADGHARPKLEKETEAEATAFIVARYFGLSNPFAADYLLSWGSDVKVLLVSLRLINQAAEAIIERLETSGMAQAVGDPPAAEISPISAALLTPRTETRHTHRHPLDEAHGIAHSDPS